MLAKGSSQRHNDGTVTNLDVTWWRNEFSRVYPRFKNLTEIWELISPLDSQFDGAKGFLRLRNVQAGRASLKRTALAVNLMRQLRPDEEPPKPLKRQKLSK